MMQLGANEKERAKPVLRFPSVVENKNEPVKPLFTLPLVYAFGQSKIDFVDTRFQWRFFDSLDVLQDPTLAQPDAIVIRGEKNNWNLIPMFAHWQLNILSLHIASERDELYNFLCDGVRNIDIVFVSREEPPAAFKKFNIPGFQFWFLSPCDFCEQVNIPPLKEVYYFIKASDYSEANFATFQQKIPEFKKYASYFTKHFTKIHCNEWDETTVFQCFQIILCDRNIFTSKQASLTLSDLDVPVKHSDKMITELANDVQKMQKDLQSLSQKMVKKKRTKKIFFFVLGNALLLQHQGFLFFFFGFLVYFFFRNEFLFEKPFWTRILFVFVSIFVSFFFMSAKCLG